MGSGDRVQSAFGRGRQAPAAEPEAVMLPPIQLPPVRLVLEVERDALLKIGDAVRETVYNAAMAGLQQAVEDFAEEQGVEPFDDGGDLPDGVAVVTNPGEPEQLEVNKPG